MTHQDSVWQALKDSIAEVIPEFSNVNLTTINSLSDLGANSIDRAEIIMLMMSRLQLKIPLITFSSAKNINDLVAVFCNALQSA